MPLGNMITWYTKRISRIRNAYLRYSIGIVSSMLIFFFGIASAQVAYHVQSVYLFPIMQNTLCNILPFGICADESVEAEPVQPGQDDISRALDRISVKYNLLSLNIDQANRSLAEIHKQLQGLDHLHNTIINPHILWASITPTLKADLHVKPSFEVDPSLDLSFVHGNLPEQEKRYTSYEKYAFHFFFQKGSMSLSTTYKDNQESLSNLMDFIVRKMNSNHSYRVVITGNASKEKIIRPNNRVSNNYELSRARAENVRNIMAQIIFDNNKGSVNIEFHYAGYSNQESSAKNPEGDRKVTICIYEMQ